MPTEVTDPGLLEQLEGGGAGGGREVTDPDLLKQLEGGPQEDLSWSQVPGQALRNLPHSALEFGKAVAQPFMHPIETAGNLAAIGSGVLGHLGLGDVDPEDKDTATAAGKFLMDRYGSVEGIKKTLATDPVGVAGDLSAVLSGGSMAGVRGAGVAARALDPISAVTGTAKAVGRGAAEVAGLQSGVGSEAVRQAARAGYEGGEGARAFRENIRGLEPTEDVVAQAREAVNEIGRRRGQAYREGMADVAKDPTILDFDRIDEGLADITKVKTFRGIPINEKTQAIREEVGQAVAQWKALGPEFHTVEGIDALKQKIGDIKDATHYGTPEYAVASRAYNAVRDTITAQAPEYAKVMKGYEEASRQIKALEHELSLRHPGAVRVDTAFRKLTSALRNNVNASFGRRAEMVKVLNDLSPTLLPKLAGQAMQPWAPRGLQRLYASLVGAGGTYGAAAGAVNPLAAAAAVASTSPRLVGETAYWGGAAARPLKHLPSAQTITAPAFQLGRIASPEHFKSGGRVTRSFRYKY